MKNLRPDYPKLYPKSAQNQWRDLYYGAQSKLKKQSTKMSKPNSLRKLDHEDSLLTTKMINAFKFDSLKLSKPTINLKMKSSNILEEKSQDENSTLNQKNTNNLMIPKTDRSRKSSINSLKSGAGDKKVRLYSIFRKSGVSQIVNIVVERQRRKHKNEKKNIDSLLDTYFKE